MIPKNILFTRTLLVRPDYSSLCTVEEVKELTVSGHVSHEKSMPIPFSGKIHNGEEFIACGRVFRFKDWLKEEM